VDVDEFLRQAAGRGPCVGVRPESPLARLPGVEVRSVEGSRTKTLDGIYDAFAEAWEFPQWFGRNADAFDDFMRDLDNMVSAGTGRPTPLGYLTLITNAHLILVEQPDLFSWFANTIPFYRDYYRDELSPPAAFGLLLSAPADKLREVRERWLSVGVQVAEVDV
jgi:Barstar (barnase inhibitor)